MSPMSTRETRSSCSFIQVSVKRRSLWPDEEEISEAEERDGDEDDG